MTKVSEVKTMVKRVIEEFSGVDILVNCAGQGYDSPVEHADIEVLKGIFLLDVVAPVVAMKLVIPVMRRRGGGSIVNVSSGTALMHLPGQSLYSGLKRALADISLVAEDGA